MSADIFLKNKLFRISGIVVSFFIFFFCIGYAFFLSRVNTVFVGKTFYFLTSTSQSVQANAYSIALDGGAGYVLQTNGRAYATLAVYLKETEADKVQRQLQKSGEETEIVKKEIDKLYLKHFKDRKNAKRIKGAVDCLYSYIQLLNGEIRRLEEGATQQSCARVLRNLSKQLYFFSKETQNVWADCAISCLKNAQDIDNIAKNTILLKDLRYMQCKMSEDFFKICKNFIL